MKDFALLFRQPSYDYQQLPEAEQAALIKKWQDWLGGIAAQGKLVSPPTRLIPNQGRVLKPGGVVTDGPFVEIRERLGGLTVIRAADLDEATTLAHGCPAIEVGGSVEIRPVMG
ncbi:YciI family protein [Chitinophaga sp. NPDC101104]|uniref:YciI family protein n=1 Tax=Chitinophaga sp. NPDC101104 TaxID=3390561 RepID=UPI003CFC08B9